MDLQIFQNQDFGQVRVFIEKGEPLFVGLDISNLLHYKNPETALVVHVDEEDRVERSLSEDKGAVRKYFLINEVGVYSLIFSSKVPIAMKFKKWFKEEVLSSVRSLQQKLPENFADALRAYADEVEKNEALLLENNIQRQLLDEQNPNESYYDWILASKDCKFLYQIAEDYGLTEKFLNEKLRELGVLFEQNHDFYLDDKYSKLGYAKTVGGTKKTKNGFLDVTFCTEWTQKGRLFLYELLKKNGILPLIEQE